ncbi:MAG: DUF1778 domain-containing protein [Comamonadaceae bacterium]|jgi:uncharacterized protein (DUF1778 family)|nr:MAG: DUF1778 domain-containing protein [Comamonadaceae bacterium]
MPSAINTNRAARIRLRITPPNEVLSPEAFRSFVAACEEPASPTSALQELMARRKASQPSSQGIATLAETKTDP